MYAPPVAGTLTGNDTEGFSAIDYGGHDQVLRYDGVLSAKWLQGGVYRPRATVTAPMTSLSLDVVRGAFSRCIAPYSIFAMPFPGVGKRSNTAGSCPGTMRRGELAIRPIRSRAARFAAASSAHAIGAWRSRFS